MKKRIITFVLALLLIPCAFLLTACDKMGGSKGGGMTRADVVYDYQLDN